MKRRELLFELALVFGGSQALDLLRILTPDEKERLAGVLRNTWRTDEAARTDLREDDDARAAGRRRVRPRHAAAGGQWTAGGGRKAPRPRVDAPCLRDRLLDTYAQLSQLAGYLAYDLLDYAAAEQPLRDGLRAALDLGDPTLIGYMHYWLGRVAADQDRTAAVFDHAFAIRSWAARSPSKLLAPLHQSLFSLAHAAEGDAAASARAHESALGSAGAPKDNEPAFLYWVSPAAVESRRTALLIRLNQPREVLKAAERYLAEHDSKFKRSMGWCSPDTPAPWPGQGDPRGGGQAHRGRPHHQAAQLGPARRRDRPGASPAGALGGHHLRSPTGRDPAILRPHPDEARNQGLSPGLSPSVKTIYPDTSTHSDRSTLEVICRNEFADRLVTAAS